MIDNCMLGDELSVIKYVQSFLHDRFVLLYNVIIS